MLKFTSIVGYTSCGPTDIESFLTIFGQCINVLNYKLYYKLLYYILKSFFEYVLVTYINIFTVIFCRGKYSPLLFKCDVILPYKEKRTHKISITVLRLSRIINPLFRWFKR